MLIDAIVRTLIVRTLYRRRRSKCALLRALLRMVNFRRFGHYQRYLASAPEPGARAPAPEVPMRNVDEQHQRELQPEQQQQPPRHRRRLMIHRFRIVGEEEFLQQGEDMMVRQWRYANRTDNSNAPAVCGA